MGDNKEKTFQKVQETYRGSQTPTLERQRRIFPPLPPPASDGRSPFRRNSLLTRSPPSGSSAAAPGAGIIGVEQDAADQGTPKSQIISGMEVSPDEKNVALAREKVDAELKRMRETLLDMRAAAERQKNVSMSIKDGVTSLEASLDVIDSMRSFWRASLQRLKLQEKETQAPSPSTVPDAPTAKRAATSPLMEREEKRQRDGSGRSAPPNTGEETYAQVVSKKEKRRLRAKAMAERKQDEAKSAPVQTSGQSKEEKKTSRPKKPRSQVVLINPCVGRTYADILGLMRKEVAPEDSGTVVRQIRKTAAGGVLLELAKCENREKLQEALEKAVGDKGVVRAIVPRLRIEILDLDSLTSGEDVSNAIKRDHPGLNGEPKVTLFAPNQREQRKAVVEMDEKDALPLLQTGKIKIGWVSCRVRQRLEVERCFRCLGYGHTRRNCSGPDRSKNCWKCGSTEHKAAVCTAAASCVLCADTPGVSSDHTPGSGACGSFRKALNAKRSRTTAK